MLVGRLLFDNDELGLLRWRAAEFIRYMIRARAKAEPGFMTAADYETWELDDLSQVDLTTDRLLDMALRTINELNQKYLERCGSGGMRIDKADPLRKLKELIGFFTDYQWALPAAIRSAIAGNPIEWAELASWGDLPAIRAELDKLPRPDSQPQAPLDGPDPHRNEIRWEKRSVKVMPMVHKLAVYLWHSQCVSKQELLEHLWPDRDGDGVLDTTLSRLNEALSATLVPWTYHCRGEFVLKETHRS